MDLRARLLQQLVTPGTESRFAHPYLVGPLAAEAGVTPTKVWEVLWGLVTDRLIYLDPSKQPATDNWHWRLTAEGVAAATSGAWEPRDPDGYLRRLRRHDPPIDAAALTYVTEALRAFNARCYLAASVMLGVASERVLDGLARSAVAHADGAAKQLQQALDNPRTTQFSQFKELRKHLEPLRPRLPEGLADTLTLDAVADLLRVKGRCRPSHRRVHRRRHRVHAPADGGKVPAEDDSAAGTPRLRPTRHRALKLPVKITLEGLLPNG